MLENSKEAEKAFVFRCHINVRRLNIALRNFTHNFSRE